MSASAPVFTARIRWTGNRGQGTRTYTGYGRDWRVETPGKPPIDCSNDPEIGGDPARHNPEDLLLDAVASCHMLWFLHLASDAGIEVVAYEDAPEGQGEVLESGAGRFTQITLRPRIAVVAGADVQCADALHKKVHELCFIARSIACPVKVAARYRVVPTQG